jgi:hypothetical protein
MGYIDYAAARPRPAEDCVVYLDHAATTPMLPEALAAMTEELGQLGNPSSLHNAGRRARRVVEESREQIAEVFGARPSEVIFTSGGTEADNLAVKGLYWARRASGLAHRGQPGGPGFYRGLPRVLATASTSRGAGLGGLGTTRKPRSTGCRWMRPGCLRLRRWPRPSLVIPTG